MKDWANEKMIGFPCWIYLTIANIVLNFPPIEAATKPNIVFILADDLGYNDVGYHGRSAIRTPCIDQLAEEGIKLENYYLQQACSPSRSQLLSGRYQIRTGLQHKVIKMMQPNALPLDNVLLPQQLNSCGYESYMVGKWHLGFYKKEFLPWNRGFDRFMGTIGGSAHYYKHTHEKNGVTGRVLYDSDFGPVTNYSGTYLTKLYTEKAGQYILSHNQTKPMFLNLAQQAVHAPLHPPEEYENMYSNITDQKRRIYARMTSSLDQSVCDVRRYLKAAGMWNNTIFIFSTDNGGTPIFGGNNWPLRGAKRTYFEGGIKGVGFISGPLLKKRNTTHNKLFHVSDWMPTLLDAADCPLRSDTPPLDGVNQWPSIIGDAPSARDEILFNIDPLFKLEQTYPMYGFDASILAAIRVGPWKLITGKQIRNKLITGWKAPPEFPQIKDVSSNWRGPYELYNIEEDPLEQHNVAAENSKVIETLFQKLAKYNRDAVPVLYPDLDPRSSPELNNGLWGPWVDK